MVTPKELKLEYLEEKDWEQMEKDIKNIKADFFSIKDGLSTVYGIISPFLTGRQTDNTFNSTFRIGKQCLNILDTKVHPKLEDITKKLENFKRWSNKLQQHAANILEELKSIAVRKASTYKNYRGEESEKLGSFAVDKFLEKDEQYAIQIGRNLNLFIDKLKLRVNFLDELVRELGLTLTNTSRPGYRWSKKVTGIDLKEGVPWNFQYAYEELGELYDYINQIRQRLNSLELNVISRLRYSIQEAMRRTAPNV